MLLVLIGLLGTHGLPSQHSLMQGMATATNGLATASMAADPQPVTTGLPARVMAMPLTTSGSISRGFASVVANASQASQGAGLGMGGLCLAVLGGVLVLVLAALRARTGDSPNLAGPRAAPLGPVRASTASPPPDLVAGLCVSRT